MKPILVVGNWKSHKTIAEVRVWIDEFTAHSLQPTANSNLKVILCVPFTLLQLFKSKIKALRLPIVLGAQNVSPYGEGAYTGEINAKQVKELCEWVIIGHSERRKYFGETDQMLSQKAGEAKKAGLNVIYCVPDEKTSVPFDVDAVAYEPVWAIGTGKSDTPENANRVITQIKAESHVEKVIYGGSVTSDNIHAFVTQSAIDGVLPGGASLVADSFLKLINHARTS